MINPNLRIESFPVIRLTSNHSILPFNCGDEDLNDFFLNSAKPHQEELLAVTYFLENKEDNDTVAFFSLINDKISAENFAGSGSQLKKRIKTLFSSDSKHLRDYPAMKIGRFAVSEKYQRNGIGNKILNVLKILFISENRTGCRFITVDAYKKSLDFYEKNNFIYFTDADKEKDTRQMYYDLFIALNSISKEELISFRKTILPDILN